jgi:hypothetical protein
VLGGATLLVGSTGPVEQGTFLVSGTADVGNVDVTNHVSVAATASSPATLTASYVRAGSLSISSSGSNLGRVIIRANGTNSGTTRVGGLSISGPINAPTAQFDLNDNKLVIDYTTSTPFNDVKSWIKSGFNNGLWNGNGLATSMGDANHGLGYAEASAIFSTFPATFGGQSIDSTTVLVAYRRYGDATMDGTVTLADFNALAANFGLNNRVWTEGDFNYDYIVNLMDFNLLAGNFGMSGSPGGPTPQDWAALAAAVPEPALLATTGAAMALLFSVPSASRRRRRL